MEQRQQKHEGPAPRGPMWIGWNDLVVKTNDPSGLLDSEAKFSTADKLSAFLDISLEQYVGTSRRAKYTSVRLEEPAARALLQLLSERFAQAPAWGGPPLTPPPPIEQQQQRAKAPNPAAQATSLRRTSNV
jgi:hypothetical protein